MPVHRRLLTAICMFSLLGSVAWALTPGESGGPPEGLVGDFNDDGFYDCLDVDALGAEIAAGTNDPDFDLNGDGVVNLNDLTAWLTVAGDANLPSGNPYRPGDANLDGVVDVSDFNIWNGSKFTSNSAWCSGDFNADGFVDGLDFIIWNTNKFTSS